MTSSTRRPPSSHSRSKRSASQNVSPAVAERRAEAQHAPASVEERGPAARVELERARVLDGPLVHQASSGPISRSTARAMPATARPDVTRSRPASTNGMKASMPTVTTMSPSRALRRMSASTSAALVRPQMSPPCTTSGFEHLPRRQGLRLSAHRLLARVDVGGGEHEIAKTLAVASGRHHSSRRRARPNRSACARDQPDGSRVAVLPAARREQRDRRIGRAARSAAA